MTPEAASTRPAGRRAPARRGDGARLRADILAATSSMLAASGDPSAISLRAVAREAGIATTSVYLHFPTLDSLLVEVRSGYFSELGEATDTAAEAAGARPRDRVLARVHAYASWAQQHPGKYHAIFIGPMLAPAGSEHVAQAGAQVFDALRQEITEATEGSPTAAMTAVHLWTALHGTVSLRSARPHFAWPDLSDELSDLVARLLDDAGAPGARR